MIERKNKKYTFTFSFILAIVVVLLTASLSYAAFVVINTTDGNIDANWSATPFRDDAKGDVPAPAGPDHDIDRFWIGTDAFPPTEFYFRADLVGTNVNPSIPLFIGAWLDCNGNGIFRGEADDVFVVYIPAGDSIEVWQADGSATDYPGSSYGEVLINGNHEWRAPVGGGIVNWNACDENPLNVRLTTMDPGYNDVDTTIARGYDEPTVVTLSDFSAYQSTSSLSLTMLMIVMVCGGGIFLLLRWFRQKRRIA